MPSIWRSRPRLGDLVLRHRGSGLVAEPVTLHLPFNNSGVDNLNPALRINGTIVYPTFRYKGGDASASGWAPWGYGSSLSLAGSGSAPTYNDGSPCLGSNDDSVLFNTTKYFQAPDNTLWTPGTNDIVFEAVCQIGNTIGGEVIFSTYVDATNFFELQTTNTTLRLVWNIGGAGVMTVNSPAFASGQWVHCIWFLDRSGSGICYGNSSAGSGANISGYSATSLTLATQATIGSRAGTVEYEAHLAYIAGWNQASWLDTHAQATVAAERFSRLCGIYPQIAKGTAVPTTASRAFEAYLDKYEYGQVRKSYLVGSNWMRVCHRRDATTDKDDPVTTSNGFAYSEDFTQSSWNKVNCTIDTSTGVYYRGREMQGIVGDTDDEPHGLSDALTPADNHHHIFSVVAKAGARDGIRLSSTNLSSQNVWVQFNLSTGTVALTGGTGTVDNSGIEEVDTDIYRCWFTYDGGTAAHTHLILPVDDASVDDATYTGDGATPDIYLIDVQHDYSDPDTGTTTVREYVRTSGVARTLGETVKGYLAERQAANILQYNYDWDDATAAWDLTNNVSRSGTSTWRDIQSNIIAESSDGGATNHFVYHTQPNAAANTTYVLSIFAKAIGRSKFRVLGTDAGAMSIQADFDLSTGQATLAAGNAAGMENWGDGWYRCWVTATATGTGGGMYAKIWLMDGAATAYVGDGRDAIEFTGIQWERGAYPTSLITTTTAARTRKEDRLFYASAGNADHLQGTIVCNVLNNNTPTADARYITLYDSTQGSGSNERILLSHSSNKGSFIIVHNNSVQSNLSTDDDINDGLKHTLRMTYKANEVTGYLDGVLNPAAGNPDTTASMPDGSDTIGVGTYYAAYVATDGQPGGLINNIKIYSEIKKP